MPVMEHGARFVYLEIFERLKMPPKLLAYLTLVHDAETEVKIDNSAFFVDKFRSMPYNLKLCGCPHWGAWRKKWQMNYLQSVIMILPN